MNTKESFEQINIKEKELKRLYGTHNREVIEKMNSLGMHVFNKPYDLNEVIRFTLNSEDKEKKKETNVNAAKADIFYE